MGAAGRAKVVLWAGIAVAIAGIGWWISLHNTGASRRGDCSLRDLRNTIQPGSGDQIPCIAGPSVYPAVITVVVGASVAAYGWAMLRSASRRRG